MHYFITKHVFYRLYADAADEVTQDAIASQQLVADIQNSLQALPSAEDDATILRVHDSCEDAIAKLASVQDRVAELEDSLVKAETKVWG